jgi:hypothetical protein
VALKTYRAAKNKNGRKLRARFLSYWDNQFMHSCSI